MYELFPQLEPRLPAIISEGFAAIIRRLAYVDGQFCKSLHYSIIIIAFAERSPSSCECVVAVGWLRNLLFWARTARKEQR